MKYDKDLTKYKFGKLTTIKISYINKNHVKIWECKYDGKGFAMCGLCAKYFQPRKTKPVL